VLVNEIMHIIIDFVFVLKLNNEEALGQFLSKTYDSFLFNANLLHNLIHKWLIKSVLHVH
jgi:hypothetical protein